MSDVAAENVGGAGVEMRPALRFGRCDSAAEIERVLRTRTRFGGIAHLDVQTGDVCLRQRGETQVVRVSRVRRRLRVRQQRILELAAILLRGTEIQQRSGLARRVVSIAEYRGCVAKTVNAGIGFSP